MPEPPPLGKLVDDGGYRVHIYCTGQGSPTVVATGGGFSFDWGLVQPKVAQFTRICTYDPSGRAWSDRIKADDHPTCTGRAKELHTLLKNAGIRGPYIAVGFSIGALIARLYARLYPNEVAGMVIVDHAFINTDGHTKTPKSSQHWANVDSPPILISKAPITLGLEDDRNFSRLPERDQQLHQWALSIHSVRPTPAMAAECFSEVNLADKGLLFPLGNRPLVVISTTYDSPAYAQLQRKLLMLSHDSEQLIAHNSTHMVIIDEPEIIVRAIRKVVQAVRNNAALRN
ncbi:MAG: alpha/beta fold hydrolase [Bryobacteraceae bacterium]